MSEAMIERRSVSLGSSRQLLYLLVDSVGVDLVVYCWRLQTQRSFARCVTLSWLALVALMALVALI